MRFNGGLGEPALPKQKDGSESRPYLRSMAPYFLSTQRTPPSRCLMKSGSENDSLVWPSAV